jgi:ubiquitin-conjugating enzyme E2 O
VQISFLDNSPPQVVSEDALVVVDRSLHLGDVVKRRAEDMMSGIVATGKMKLLLQHTFTGQMLETVESEHVRSAFDFNEGTPLQKCANADQYLLFENRWVGQIEEVLQDVTVRLSDNSLVQVEKPHDLDLATNEGTAIVDQSLFLSDKFVVGQHVVTEKSNLRRGRWILGEYNPNIDPHGVVVDVRTKRLTVNWVAQRHQGPGDAPINIFAQPDAYIFPDEDAVVVLSVLSDPTSYQIGDRVRFLDREVETGHYDAQRMDRRDLGGFDGNVWMVVGTKTVVSIDWQDGTTSEDLQARDLRMYLNVDEYEGWPVYSCIGSSNFRANLCLRNDRPEVHDSESFNPLHHKNVLLGYASSMKVLYYPKSRKSVYTISIHIPSFNMA